MKTIRVFILGFGVIGQGFARILLDKSDYLKERHGLQLEVAGIAERSGCLISKEGGLDLQKVLAQGSSGLSSLPDWQESMNAKEMFADVSGDIAVELVPSNIETGEPGLSMIRAALESNLHAVSSDKCAVAPNYMELNSLAKEKGLLFLFEGAAGGGMPVMNLYRECLQVDTVESIKGILNGTTNYILTKMSKGGMDLETALREAQELGYAEADPTYDVEGIDAAAKAVILANNIMGINAKISDVKVTGIMGVTKEAVDLAGKNGYSVKLIASVKQKNGKTQLLVSPKLVPKGHPLDIDSNLNAVLFTTDVGRDVTVIGRGAGGQETQSAIFSDVIRIAKEI